MKNTKSLYLWALALLLAVAPSSNAINVNVINDLMIDKLPVDLLAKFTKIIGCHGE